MQQNLNPKTVAFVDVDVLQQVNFCEQPSLKRKYKSSILLE